MYILEFNQVSYTYPGSLTSALNKLSIKIPKGKKCALLGHNGCGKSTLFLHATGIIQPQQGEIVWKSAPIDYGRKSVQALRRQIGYVFQDPEQQLIAGTVAEDLSYGLYNFKVPPKEIETKVEKALKDYQLESLAHTPLHQLSPGLKKKVALAGVMILEPELLLLDEPTAYLDRLSTRILLDQLEDIKSKGTTMLMATHDMDLAYSWADYIFVMEKGEIVLEGCPDKIFSQKERLEKLNLEVPLLLEVWHSLLQNGVLSNGINEKNPHTLKELKEKLTWSNLSR